MSHFFSRLRPAAGGHRLETTKMDNILAANKNNIDHRICRSEVQLRREPEVDWGNLILYFGYQYFMELRDPSDFGQAPTKMKIWTNDQNVMIFLLWIRHYQWETYVKFHSWEFIGYRDINFQKKKVFTYNYAIAENQMLGEWIITICF